MYDDFSVDYDRFVAWSGRLAVEMPFIERELEKVGARLVLDAACGTGMHTIALAERGLPIHLTTTDPAQHIREVLASELPGVRVRFIDPKKEAQDYRDRTLESARPTLSAEKLALPACYQ